MLKSSNSMIMGNDETHANSNNTHFGIVPPLSNFHPIKGEGGRDKNSDPLKTFLSLNTEATHNGAHARAD